MLGARRPCAPLAARNPNALLLVFVGRSAPMRNRHASDLDSQGLRLTRHDRDRLTALAIRLRATGTAATAGTVARGLCLLALDLAMGAVDDATAEACRLAARDPASARNAVNTFVFLLDVEPPTRPISAPHAREGLRNCARARSRPTLQTQALRLPQQARQNLKALGAAAGVSATEAMRGLCTLALDLASGAAGQEIAGAVLSAASDPTPEGIGRALGRLHSLLGHGPAPAWEDPPPPSTQRAA